MIRRLLIANRGEIAIRIARGARELGIEPCGIYSDADEHAAFRDVIHNTLRIGPGPASESYLKIDAVVDAARQLGADAVHPGYGFLSERAEFAQAVVDAGLIFVGPTAAAIAAMGDKREAKRRMRAAGIPVVAGYDGNDQHDATLRREAQTIGTPLLIKAAAGGGGRGMRVITDLAQFDDALASARREAKAAFGDDAMLLERYVARPRHIEFQILGDAHGTVVHLGERECSIQRRHQKVVEEAPSVALDAALRDRMGAAAVAAATTVGYTNAGTVEFLLDEDGSFSFLEMNARLQVEHPITELVYGVDLVHEQLRIASGEPLRFAQHELQPRGWAIEVRLVAEDPAHDNLPQTGTIARFAVPNAPGVRLDAGVRDGSEISPYYDSLLAKIIVSAEDRPAAIARLVETLRATRVVGIATNLPQLAAIAADDAFARGDTTTRFLEERAAALRDDDPDRIGRATVLGAAAVAAAGRAWRLGGIGTSRSPSSPERRSCTTVDRDVGRLARRRRRARRRKRRARRKRRRAWSGRGERHRRGSRLSLRVRTAAERRRAARPQRGRQRHGPRPDAGESHQRRRRCRRPRCSRCSAGRSRSDEDGAPHRSPGRRHGRAPGRRRR